jgi:hypothetical protein
LGAIFARHETALTLAGTGTGVVGAAMTEDLTISGSGSGAVIATSTAEISSPDGLVGAQLNTVTDIVSAVVANGTEVTSTTNLVGVGVAEVSTTQQLIEVGGTSVTASTNAIGVGVSSLLGGHTNVMSLGCGGAGFTATTGGLVVGGSPASATGAASYVGIGTTLTGTLGSSSSVGTVSVGGSMTTIAASQGVVSVGTAHSSGVVINKGGAILGGSTGATSIVNRSDSGAFMAGVATTSITNRGGGLVAAGCTGNLANITSAIQVGYQTITSGGYNLVSVGKLASATVCISMQATGSMGAITVDSQNTEIRMNPAQIVMWNGYGEYDPEFQIPADPHCNLYLGTGSGDDKGIGYFRASELILLESLMDITLDATGTALIEAFDIGLTSFDDISILSGANLILDADEDLTLTTDIGAFVSTGYTHSSVATGGGSPTHTP